MTGDDRGSKRTDRSDPDSVGADHQPPAIPTVRCDARREREQREWQHAHERDDARLRGGVRHRKDEQWIGHGG